jgi:lysozyme
MARQAHHLSSFGLGLIAGFEGFRAKAYKPVKAEQFWTIGYGHSGPDVKRGMVITRARGLQLLKRDTRLAALTVDHLVRAPINQHRFDALTSFCFNVGAGNFASSTLLRLLNGGNYGAVPGQLMRWDRDVNGQVLRGLQVRRAVEAALWRKPA